MLLMVVSWWRHWWRCCNLSHGRGAVVQRIPIFWTDWKITLPYRATTTAVNSEL